MAMILKDWEMLQESISSALAIEKDNILTIRFILFLHIGVEGNLEATIERLKELKRLVDMYESKNTDFMFETSRFLIRICGRSYQVLTSCLSILEKCRKCKPLEADYVIESGYAFQLLGKFDKALAAYQEAAEIDESRVESLIGTLTCKLEMGEDYEDLQSQIEFLNTTMATEDEKNPDVIILGALVSARAPEQTPETQQSTLAAFDDGLMTHIRKAQGLAANFSFFVTLNPDTIVLVCKEMTAEYVLDPFDTSFKGKLEPSKHLLKSLKLLETTNKQLPGLLPCYILTAKLKLVMGNYDGAKEALNKVTECNYKNEEAGILNAALQLITKNKEGSKAAVQEALSNNFEIRKNPVFMLIKGSVEYNFEETEEALKTFQTAYDLITVQTLETHRSEFMSIISLGDGERAKIFIGLARCYAACNQHAKAKEIMDAAVAEFTGTPQETDVFLANSDLALLAGEVKKALGILKGVDSSKPSYLQAQKKLADIYLNKLSDRRRYAKCFGDMCLARPTYENYKSLGDALLIIQEADDAIAAYQEAMRLKPKDDMIIRCLGSAMVLTHDYDKAIQFYRDTLVKNPKRLDIAVDLGKLYLIRGQLNEVEQLLTEDLLGESYETQDSASIKTKGEAHQLACKFFQKKFLRDSKPVHLEKVENFAKGSLVYQKKLVEKLKFEGGGDPEAERNMIVTLLLEISGFYTSIKSYNNALVYLEQASKMRYDDVGIAQKIVKLHLMMGSMDQVETKVPAILKLNSRNEFGIHMYMEILIRKKEAERAAIQIRKILDEKVDNFKILRVALCLFRKMGLLDIAKEYIEKASAFSLNTSDTGLAFCKGLYAKYTRDPKSALLNFAQAKKNSYYKSDAIVEMIDIYLNPDSDPLYSSLGSSSGIRTIEPENIDSIKSLLAELSQKEYPNKDVLESYLKLVSKSKGDNQEMLENIVKTEPHNMAANLALAILYFSKGNSKGAKAVLKTLSKAEYNPIYSEELEKGWLLVGDYLISIKVYDKAEEEFRKCLNYNQSCGKAYEYLGMIAEIQNNPKDAASYFEKAWKLCNERDGSIGYRLALNYLLSRKVIESITISQQVTK